MSPIRRDEEGWEVGPTWESIVDKKIRQAMDEGVFDNLPGAGRPQELDENPFAGDWGLGFHVMRNAGVAPLWIELSQEIQRRLDAGAAFLQRVAELSGAPRPALRTRLRQEYAQQVAELNETIARFNAVVPFDWLQKLPVSVEAELRKFDEQWPPR